MTHRDHRNEFEFEAQSNCSSADVFQEILELLVDRGFEGLAIGLLINFGSELIKDGIARVANGLVDHR